MTTLAQRSFAGGEIAPALYARVDTVKYATGLRTLRNFFVMRHGGAASRPGTGFVAEVKDSTKSVRMIPFVFNASQTYILEFGDLYMRVHKNGVQLTDSTKTISGVTQANPAVVTATAHGFSNGDEIAISSILGMTQLDNRNFKVTNVTANTFQLTYMNGTVVDSTAFTAYVSGGTASRVYQLTTPYAYTDLPALKFVQSADVVTLVHPSYAPRELARTGDTIWTLTAITFAPTVAAPTGLTSGSGTIPGSGNLVYAVTAISDDTSEESLTSAPFTLVATAAPTGPSSAIALTWVGVAGCSNYNVYRMVNGIYGFLGESSGTAFSDIGITPSLIASAPVARNPFPGVNDYPGSVSYFQQRLTFGNSNNKPETIWTSKSGEFKNFTTSTPLQDNDAITFRLTGKQVNQIQHIVDLGKMLVLTSGGEWAVQGDVSGILKPTGIDPKQYSYYGSGIIPPIVIGGNILYVQARGGIVRDLSYDFMVDGYKGNDLTIFSAHLLDGFTIVDWAFQQIPNSIVWMARSDGALIGLTYVKEQQLAGWHRHDFDGSVEGVCSVPEGNEDAVYLVIKRTVNGRTVRYIERMYTRHVSNIVDYVGMDAVLKYDGRNTSATTMTLSGGTSNWDNTQTLTLTASASTFLSSDVGKQIFLDIVDAKGKVTSQIRFTITAYTSGTVVTGSPNRNVDVGLRSTPTTHWSKAVQTVTGLWHLEGKNVSVFADGYVVASPNNSQSTYPVQTVTNGTLTLDKPYAVISAGLPITCDIETLDIDTAQVESIADKKKIISKVTCFVESSRGLWSGSTPPSDDTVDPLEGLTELKTRSDENYDDPVSLATGTVDINIQSQWNANGRVFLRQIDPLPLSVLAIAPAGLVPIGRG